MTDEEKLHLDRLSQEFRRGMQARETIIQSNQGLVRNITNSSYRFLILYSNSEIDFDDLVSQGNIGLMRAIFKYEPKRGLKFSTYATNWVRQTIADYVQKNNFQIHIPKLIQLQIHTLTECLLKDMSTDEIARAMEISEERVHFLMSVREMQPRIRRESESIETELGIRDLQREGQDTVYQAERQMVGREIYTLLRSMLDNKQITIRHIQVVKMYFFENKTYAEIGKELGISHQAVRMIVIRVFKFIRRDPDLMDKLIDFYQVLPRLSLDAGKAVLTT